MTDASSLLPPPRRYVPELERMNFKWAVVYDLYRNIAPAPPLGYLDSLELTLVIKGAVDDADVRAIYSHGRPMEFWGCPRLFVSKIVEAFIALHEEPTYLDVTITVLHGYGAMRPSEAWPQVYKTYLPCYGCNTVKTVEERSIPRPRNP
ncbi:hypothetical protein AAVH_24026 [Aphelenchoides avenae]|nr:hypothetical protein AAVH_24025 [Aphelenchus avenae]KAH7708700.1 hypothetical protein AAVH_24026 [Aphelenchus avenae]